MSSGYCKRLVSRTLIASAAVTALAASPRTALADPPGRVARISVVNGPVSFRAEASDEWDAATPNYPLTSGDRLWADHGAQAEVDLGSSVLRLGALTDVGFLGLDDRAVQVRVASGTVSVHLRDGWQDVFEVDTPNGAVSLLTPGTYRIDVSPNGDVSTITVRRGNAAVVAAGYSYPIGGQESLELDGLGSPRTLLRDAVATDAFEDWCIARDRREDAALSARYVPEDVVGYADLDDYGSWSSMPEYGAVWTPRVAAGWAPYRDGRWMWVDPWGWTWVDAEPWGFAPFHYGRWVSLRGGWAWVPGHFVARPVFAPALVAFVGGPAWSASFSFGSEPVCWFPLGPHEPYVPAYLASERYVRAINAPHVNVTNINVNVTRINYVNRDVPGALTAVPRDAFVRSRPVNAVAVAVPRDRAAGATVVGYAAPIGAQPRDHTRDARGRTAAPPPSIANRAVVVRRQPPSAASEPRAQTQTLRPQSPRSEAPPSAAPATVPAWRPARPTAAVPPGNVSAPSPTPPPAQQQQALPHARARGQQPAAPALRQAPVPQRAPQQVAAPQRALSQQARPQQALPPQQARPQQARPQQAPSPQPPQAAPPATSARGQSRDAQSRDGQSHDAQSHEAPRQRPTSRRPPR